MKLIPHVIAPAKVCVLIPSYKVTRHILGVIAAIGPEVERIYVIDDCCPEQSGIFVQSHCNDDRVTVLFHGENQGVGGAVMTGYKKAKEDGMTIAVKIDGDGQMDPSLILQFIEPILAREADYTKGNRFFDIETVRSMPPIRIFGNAVLSFLTKLSAGYWNIFDPTNGYTAIHLDVLKLLPIEKISRRYFFETDMLFRLNTARAVVVDIPMEAKYGDEVSNLKISKIFWEFLGKHLRNLTKRIFYNYYLRDMSLASIELPIGIFSMTFGIVFGISAWSNSSGSGIPNSAGTVMLPAIAIIVGLQLILAFLAFDISNVPSKPIHKRYLP